MLRVSRGIVCALAAVVLSFGAATLQAQNKLAAAPPVTYDNKFEVYGGLNYMDFQAGQNLPQRMNLGGIETSATYWATRKLGVTADFRGDAGTTLVFPNPYTVKPLVTLFTGMAGFEYRGPKNQRFAVDYHAFGGVSAGNFSYTPIPANEFVGLYTNRVKPMYAFGGSLDLNRSKNLAIRLSPDLILEHFGTENRIFFQISAGLVYRIGKK
jgi:hypothetical protein